MSATEELRRMLDERGVEWSTSYYPWDKDDITYWVVGQVKWVAIENEGGAFVVNASITNDLTPEQAIAATLGAGTCKQEEHGWGTEGDHARVWLTCGHDCMVETVADLPHFCPTCGAKVVDE